MTEEEKVLSEFYGAYDEDGRLATRHGSVEFLTTMRYVKKYLRTGDRVLEIGAGTGRYSHALAREGYRVDAVELVPHNIEIFKRNTREGERVTVTQGNALDLTAFADGSYDITLLLGPMYHLYTAETQLKALSEAIRVTKKGGTVFVAYCGNDATIVRFCFMKGKLKEERYKNLVDPVTFKAASSPAEVFALHRREEIDDLMKGFSVQRLHFVGTDMATDYMSGVVDEMDDDFFNTYLNYHFSICERQDLVGASNHFLDVFKKL